jgi:uncharacterized membrane protein YhaH (DUF805 family)
MENKKNLFANFADVLKDFTDFNGRSRRYEFWGFMLILIIIRTVTSTWDNILFDGNDVFRAIINVLFFLPLLALKVRRLHDVGRSGWWMLLGLTGIGYLVLLYWFVKDSEPGENEYGVSPKYPYAVRAEEPAFKDLLV